MPRFGSLHMILKLLVYVRFAILKTIQIIYSLCLTLCCLKFINRWVWYYYYMHPLTIRANEKKKLYILTNWFHKLKDSFCIDYSSYIYLYDLKRTKVYFLRNKQDMFSWNLLANLIFSPISSGFSGRLNHGVLILSWIEKTKR